MAESLKVLTALNVNLHDKEELLEFVRQDTERAGERARKAVQDLQDRGILDADGKRIRTDIPEDMLPGSKTDFGG